MKKSVFLVDDARQLFRHQRQELPPLAARPGWARERELKVASKLLLKRETERTFSFYCMGRNSVGWNCSGKDGDATTYFLRLLSTLKRARAESTNHSADPPSLSLSLDQSSRVSFLRFSAYSRGRVENKLLGKTKQEKTKHLRVPPSSRHSRKVFGQHKCYLVRT